MDVDHALEGIGLWNKRRLVAFSSLCLGTYFPTSLHMLAIIFVGAEPPHHCRLPENATMNGSIPYTVKDGQVVWDQCNVYTDEYLNKTVACPNGWEYDPSYGNTIVTQWDLVCDKNYLSDLSQTIFVIGVMLGAAVFSQLSDYFGRKLVWIGSQLGIAAVSTVLAFSSNVIMFTALRFFAGAFQQGIHCTGVVLACELFPTRIRTTMYNIFTLFWMFGALYLPFLAYFIRDWRHLLLVISIPGFLSFVFYWLVDKSIPRLIAKGHHKEALEVLVKYNKSAVLEPDPEGADVELTGGSSREVAKEEPAKNYSVLDIFKHRILLKTALITLSMWFIINVVYYGLNLSSTSLYGDRFINYVLMNVVEIPATIFCFYALLKLGRRKSSFGAMITAGVALITVAFVPTYSASGTHLGILTNVIALLGKWAITIAFNAAILYTPELYPTDIRNSGLGFASATGRIGGAIGPVFAYFAKMVFWVPSLICGIISVLVGCLILLLPETYNRPLPQTIAELKDMSRTGLGQGCCGHQSGKALDKGSHEQDHRPLESPL